MRLTLADIPDGHFAGCQALVYSLLQRFEDSDLDEGCALALVSAHPKAGVTHVRRLIELMLNENDAECAISLDCDALGLTRNDQEEAHQHVKENRHHKRSRALRPAKGLVRYRDRVGHLKSLREQYRYVILDCHSISQRTDVLGLAPVVDGTITIVECNRTTTNQLQELERSIEKYGGSIFGCVLNKTEDTVPRWMNSLMERVGI